MNGNTNHNVNESTEDSSASARPKYKFGIIGLILGISGLGISASVLFIILFIMGAGGGLDIMLTPTQSRFIVIALYCGLILGIVGGVLGGMDIRSGETKLAGIVSVLLGVLMLCACSAITLLILTFNLMV